jgi:hypothetical protein
VHEIVAVESGQGASPQTEETVEKLAKSGEVWVSEGFSREFAFAYLAPYQWVSRFIRAAQ